MPVGYNEVTGLTNSKCKLAQDLNLPRMENGGCLVSDSQTRSVFHLDLSEEKEKHTTP